MKDFLVMEMNIPPVDPRLFKNKSHPGLDGYYYVSMMKKHKWKWIRSASVVPIEKMIGKKRVKRVGDVLVDGEKKEWVSLDGKSWSLLNPTQPIVVIKKVEKRTRNHWRQNTGRRV